MEVEEVVGYGASNAVGVEGIRNGAGYLVASVGKASFVVSCAAGAFPGFLFAAVVLHIVGVA